MPMFDRVRSIAQQILVGLGDGAPDWTVLDVVDVEVSTTERESVDLVLVSTFAGAVHHGSDAGCSELSVVAGPRSGGNAVRAYFALDLSEPEAIARLASDLQDHASESDAAFGVPLPPCPGHRHPLSAEVHDGVAVWVCPESARHHQRPIVR